VNASNAWSHSSARKQIEHGLPEADRQRDEVHEGNGVGGPVGQTLDARAGREQLGHPNPNEEWW
jgi:hypothetical protein